MTKWQLMVPPRHPSDVAVRTSVSLTDLLGDGSVREQWAAVLPETKAVVRSINRRAPATAIIEPCEWTKKGRYGLVGAAYDYLVGATWGSSLLESVTRRSAVVRPPRPEFPALVPALL